MTLNVAPWVWALLVTAIMQFGGAIWFSATIATRLDYLSERVSRLERQIDILTTETRGLTH